MFAAASLTESFTEVGEAFTAANPDAKATFSFDASSALVQQITEGAPADVFASADTANMDKLTDAGLNGSEPVIFATNLLTIIVAPDNPLGITGVADLANPDIKTVDLRPEVPCGNYANQIFTAAGVDRDAGQPRAERPRRRHQGDRRRGRRRHRLRHRRHRRRRRRRHGRDPRGHQRGRRVPDRHRRRLAEPGGRRGVHRLPPRRRRPGDPRRVRLRAP